MRAIRCLLLSLVIGCVVTLPRAASAQTITGSIQGTVLDQSGAALPGATLTITNTETGATRSAVTNGSGNYNAALLPPGHYNVSASLEGFQTIQKTGLTLEVNQNARIDFALKLSSVEESVQVTAEAPLVDTADTSTKVVVDNKKIVGLPLNGRNFVDLGLTVPGVQPISQGSNVASRGGGMNIVGVPETANNYLLDGFDNNDPTTGEVQTFPSVDAIQEFTILGGSYPADVGFASGGVVSVVTKSGSSVFHGGGFEFLRNSKFDEKNYFATENPPLNRNQYGGNLGGPAPFAHTFFFVAYEGTRNREGKTTTSLVPTAAMKSGDFSAAGTSIHDPLTGKPFPGNVIPASRISPIGAAILQQLYPDPNSSGATRNYIISPTVADDLHVFDGRVDYQPSGRNSFFARYQMYWDTQENPGSAAFPLSFNSVNKHNQNIGVEWTHVYSPNVLQEARFSYGHVYNGIWPNDRNDWDSMLGITGTLSENSKGFLDMGPPTIRMTGYASINPQSNPFLRIHHLWEGAYALTQNHGNHALKYGATYRKYSMELHDSNNPMGSFTFTGQYSGNAVADALLGYPAQTTNTLGPELTRELSWQTAVYAQDSWRATQRLTLNYGLRWEYQAPDVEPNNQWGTFVPSLGQNVQVGTNGVLPSIRTASYSDFAPRAGLAWDISGNGDGSRVLRGNYGIYYESLNHNIVYSSFLAPPISFRGVFTGDRAQPTITLANPFPAALAAGVSSSQGLDPDYHGGRTQRWMADVQQAFGGSGMIDVAYVGSAATGMGVSYNLNQPTPGPGVVTARRPYPNFSTITWTDPTGVAHYQALQAKFQERLIHGFSFLVAYTLSRATNNDHTNQDPLNRAADDGPAPWDRTHVLVTSGTYNSPFESAAFKDWEIGLIWTLESGPPVTPTLSKDVANVGSFNQRPNVSGDPNQGPKTPDQWFNTDAFSIPAAYTYGNAGVGIIRGPGLSTVNLALSRGFSFGGSRALRLRVEAFNLFNRANFLLPNATADSPQFGTIFQAGPARELQLGFKFLF
jgi:outer membrane receptor protein involved in Fe transport